MSETLPQPQDCCQPCTTPVTVQVPGPQGPAGTNGADGADGAAGAVWRNGNGAPSNAVGVDGDYYLDDVTGNVYHKVGGAYAIVANIVGPQGTSGFASPTTTKGDIIADNGASSPAANPVRLGVGTDGQILAANSSQATGLKWTTILPNTAANSGDIPIFSGTTGTPMALVDSKLKLDSAGAPQNVNGTPNARGTAAVDLQGTRAANTQVASGNYSAIGGGENNTASGTTSTVAGGNTNVANTTNTTVGGGANNTASSAAATVAGGSLNTASGAGSFVAGVSNTASGSNSDSTGSGNTAAGNFASAKGFQSNATLYGQNARASGDFGTLGDAQISEVILRNATTDATPTVLFLDGASANLVLENNKAYGFDGVLVRRKSDGASRAWSFAGVIKRGANAAATAIVGSRPADVDMGHDDTNGSFTVTADTANGALAITVTGVGGTNYRWLARVRMVELNY